MADEGQPQSGPPGGTGDAQPQPGQPPGGTQPPTSPGAQPGNSAGQSQTGGPAGQSQQPGPEGAQGQIRYQDPSTTTPREPTLAERKARERAEQRQAEQQAAAYAAAERKTQARRRVMIGGGVTVGVVALISAFYVGTAYSNTKNASTQTCTVTENGRTVVRPDEECDDDYAHSHHGYYHSGGFWVVPYSVGGRTVERQYRYSYTPAGQSVPGVGQPVSSPNFSKPSGQINTRSGTTVQRGGFGSFSGKSSGGS